METCILSQGVLGYRGEYTLLRSLVVVKRGSGQLAPSRATFVPASQKRLDFRAALSPPAEEIPARSALKRVCRQPALAFWLENNAEQR